MGCREQCPSWGWPNLGCQLTFQIRANTWLSEASSGYQGLLMFAQPRAQATITAQFSTLLCSGSKVEMDFGKVIFPQEYIGYLQPPKAQATVVQAFLTPFPSNRCS
jgi:hypothetical protein